MYGGPSFVSPDTTFVFGALDWVCQSVHTEKVVGVRVVVGGVGDGGCGDGYDFLCVFSGIG